MKLLSLIGALLMVAFIGGCGDEDEPDRATGEGETAIVLETPKPGENLTSPVTVSGTASVFEGTVQIRIIGEDGEEIVSTFATASGGAPGRGEFSKKIPFRVSEAQEALIEAYEADVATGAEGSPAEELFTVSVPVRLQP